MEVINTGDNQPVFAVMNYDNTSGNHKGVSEFVGVFKITYVWKIDNLYRHSKSGNFIIDPLEFVTTLPTKY